jgi:uncharacterized protein YdeI (YjbR/CyaY-like superfamily)
VQARAEAGDPRAAHRPAAADVCRHAGRRAVEAAKGNGWWSIYDAVEDLVEPDDLAEALDASPRARHHWAAFPPSARKQMLWWVVSAARADTRARRIAAIVTDAEAGRRVGQ